MARNASTAQIKAARSARAKVLKPQADQGDEAKDRELARVNHAYDVLGDETKRAEWDLANPAQTAGQQSSVNRPEAGGRTPKASGGAKVHHVGLLGGLAVGGHGAGVVEQERKVADTRILLIRFASGDVRPILAGFAGLSFE